MTRPTFSLDAMCPGRIQPVLTQRVRAETMHPNHNASAAWIGLALLAASAILTGEGLAVLVHAICRALAVS